MLNELTGEYPQLKAHMIYNIMKQMDFTKELVVARIKFLTQNEPRSNHNQNKPNN